MVSVRQKIMCILCAVASFAFPDSVIAEALESVRPKRISFFESGKLVRETDLKYDQAGNIIGGSDTFHLDSSPSKIIFTLSYRKDGFPVSISHETVGEVSTIMDYAYSEGEGELESVTHYFQSREHRLYRNEFILENGIIRGYRLISFVDNVKDGEMIYHFNEEGVITGKEFYENNVLSFKITNQYDSEHRLRQYTMERVGSEKKTIALIDYETGLCSKVSYRAFFWE